MNKTELIAAVAGETNTSAAATQRVLDATLDSIAAALAKGEEVSIIGFGKFSVAHRAAREGRNPRTGERIQIKASKAPKFTAGIPLKNRVNGAR